MSAVPEGIVAAATRLNMEPGKLVLLPEDFLRSCINKCALSEEQEAAALLWLAEVRANVATPATTEGTELKRYLAAQEQRKLFKWMEAEERALHHHRRMVAACDADKAGEGLRDEFVRAAKTGLLSPIEVLVGQYVVFAHPDVGPLHLMHLLLHVPPTLRVQVHNWGLAQQLPATTRDAYGDAIAALTLPLFPPASPELGTLNTKLLSKAMIEGGDTKKARLTGMFREDATLFGGDGVDESPTGGSVFPVVETPQGPGVDVSAVEAAFDNVFAQLRTLQEQVFGLPKEKVNERPADTLAKTVAGLRKQIVSMKRALTTHRTAPAPQYHQRANRNRNYSTNRPRGGEGEAALNEDSRF